MFTRLLHCVVLALCATLTQAINYIPPQHPDTNITLDLSTELVPGYLSGYDTYRIYLWTNVNSVGYYMNTCYLVKSVSTTTTTQVVQIPSSVGDNSGLYAFMFQVSDTLPRYKDLESGIESLTSAYSYFNVSNFFSVTGDGRPAWSAEEQRTSQLDNVDPDNVPCSAYNCARICSVAYTAAEYRQIWDCIAKCPGVTYPSSDVKFGVKGQYSWSLDRMIESQTGSVPSGVQVVTETVSKGSTTTVFETSTDYGLQLPTGMSKTLDPASFWNGTASKTGTGSVPTGTGGGVVTTSSGMVLTTSVSPTPTLAVVQPSTTKSGGGRLLVELSWVGAGLSAVVAALGSGLAV